MSLKEVLQTSRRYLLVILTFIVLIVPVLFHSVLGISLSPILSGSMSPVFNTGDLLITKDVPAHLLKVGDVVVLRNGVDYSLFAHRIVRIFNTGDMIEIQTKGDANPTADQGTLRIAANEVLPQGLGRLPWAGKALDSISRNKLSLLADFGLIAFLSVLLNRFFFYRSHHDKTITVQRASAKADRRTKIRV